MTPYENNYEFKQDSNLWTFNVFLSNSSFLGYLKNMHNLYILKSKNIKIGSGAWSLIVGGVMVFFSKQLKIKNFFKQWAAQF